MSPILLTGPAVEPLSLDETKTFLRVQFRSGGAHMSAKAQ